MTQWSTTTITWITLDGGDQYIRVDQIESVTRQNSGAIKVRMISGQVYYASNNMTMKKVLDLMAGRKEAS